MRGLAVGPDLPAALRRALPMVSAEAPWAVGDTGSLVGLGKACQAKESAYPSPCGELQECTATCWGQRGFEQGVFAQGIENRITTPSIAGLCPLNLGSMRP